MIVYFDYAAAAVLTLILITARLRKLTRGSANRMLLLAVATTLVTTVFDIASILLDGLPGIRTLQYFVNEMYLFFHVFSATFYLFYLISVADTWHKLRRDPLQIVLLVVPIAVFAFMLFTSGFTGLIMYIDGSGHYCRGSMFLLTYAISGLYLVLSMIQMIRYRRLFTWQELGILIAPYPLLLIAMAIQLFLPQLLVEMLADALALLLVWCNVQRPEELLDPTTGLGNRTTYHAMVKRALEVDKPLYILRIEVRKVSELQETYGIQGSAPLMKLIADKMIACNKKARSHADMCHNRERVYFMLIKERYFDTVFKLGKLLEKELCFDYEYRQNTYDVHSFLCLYRIPQEVADFDAIGNLGNLFLDENLKPDTFYTAERLFREKKYSLRIDINKVIEHGLINNNFELYYQPIYDFRKRRFTGAEALLRLYDNQYGFISPEYVITAAEENGMMGMIDDVIMNTALQMLAKEHPEKYGLRSLDINLSISQCRSEHLADNALSLIEKYGVRSDMLNFEITETAAAEMSPQLMDNLKKLHDAGVKISIDDFGKGYSNLRQITEFPLDMVKLDQSLADVINKNALITLDSNIIPMLQQMNLETLIEGVENDEQARIFERIGCDYCQGYFYAKPMNTADFIAFLRRQSEAEREG